MKYAGVDIKIGYNGIKSFLPEDKYTFMSSARNDGQLRVQMKRKSGVSASQMVSKSSDTL